MEGLAIVRLANRPEVIPVIATWLESEWPGYYGPGGRGSARRDLQSYAHAGGLPLGLVAFLDGEPCGFAALKAEAFPSHPHLMPWAGAAYVRPALRRRGVGQALFLALEAEAASLGYATLHCATATSASLLRRGGWREFARVPHEGEEVAVFEKSLRASARPESA